MQIKPLKSFKRLLTVPPDKSITHRSLILGCLAEGETVVNNPLLSLDTLSTVRCLTAMGGDLAYDGKAFTVKGELKSAEVFCGNSATTMRLLMGVAATLKGTTVFSGDKSLMRRPMERVLYPLRLMGATAEGYKICGGELHGIDYALPIPSAQVKSALILAALSAEGETVLRGRTDSRTHTETLVKLMGGDIRVDSDVVRVKKSKLKGAEITVPGDPSSAAYPALMALLIKGGFAYIKDVCASPSRLGFYRKLIEAGGKITLHDSGLSLCRDESLGEEGKSLTIEVENSRLKPFAVKSHEIPYMIDEIPLLAVAACFAEGESVFEGLTELKTKESDRLSGIVNFLKKGGANARLVGDDLVIEGRGKFPGGNTFDGTDHRMVMTAAVAFSASENGGRIEFPQSADISYPDFFDLLL